jgi:hypothetical protein
MKKKYILVFAIIMLLAFFIGKFMFGKVHIVDPKPCIEAAERYYSALELKSHDRVSTFFNPEFLAHNEQICRDLLVGLQQKYGPVTEIKLMESRIVPDERIGCTLLCYQVHRGQFVTQENIIFRPDNSAPPTIIGYELIRLDTGQKFAIGLSNREVGIKVP